MQETKDGIKNMEEKEQQEEIQSTGKRSTKALQRLVETKRTKAGTAKDRATRFRRQDSGKGDGDGRQKKAEK
jgi:hypothetical protein